MTTMGPTTRYLCPLPGCGWEHDVTPADGPLAVEMVLRLHVDDHSVMEYLRALLAAQRGGESEPQAETPLAVGQVLHGFCGGIFGRDHYDCSRIEALGPDWVVIRDDEDFPGFAQGADRLANLREHRSENDHCRSHPCAMQPIGEPS